MRIEWVLPKPSTASWIDMSCWGVARSSPPQHPQHPWGPKTPDKVILYLHGGAYLLCTPASLRGITFSLSGALQVEHGGTGPPVFRVGVLNRISQQHP